MKKIVKSLCLVGVLLFTGLATAQTHNCYTTCPNGWTYSTYTSTAGACCSFREAVCGFAGGPIRWNGFNLICAYNPGTEP